MTATATSTVTDLTAQLAAAEALARTASEQADAARRASSTAARTVDALKRQIAEAERLERGARDGVSVNLHRPIWNAANPVAFSAQLHHVHLTPSPLGGTGAAWVVSDGYVLAVAYAGDYAPLRDRSVSIATAKLLHKAHAATAAPDGLKLGRKTAAWEDVHSLGERAAGLLRELPTPSARTTVDLMHLRRLVLALTDDEDARVTVDLTLYPQHVTIEGNSIFGVLVTCRDSWDGESRLRAGRPQ